MTGNIIGEEFEPYVFDQIGLRQSAQGKGLNSIRDPQALQYLSNTNSFLKLASSVNIEEGYGVERLGKIIGDSDAGKYKGFNLSKNAVLFNGLSALEDGTYTQRAGVSNNSKLWDNTSAYGLGGSDFGLQPMPGIIDASIRTVNRGSIRKAQVTLKAFNRFQFEVIELLYLRLGFTMMLEWGHNKFINAKDESGNIQTQEIGNTLIEETWFVDQGITQLEMLNKIEKKRDDYLGNYDGFFGKVSNFEWSFENDGSYTIKLDLITLGDIVESLKINVPLPLIQVKKIKETKSESTEKEGDSLYKDLLESPIVTSAENDSISVWLFNSIANEELWGDDSEYNDYFSLLNATANSDIPEEDKKKIKPQYSYFVTLQVLLDKVISLLPTVDNNGVVDNIIDIYNSPINNYVKYFPNQFSTDPRVCIINPVFGGASLKGFKTPSYFSSLKNYVGQTNKAIYGQLMHVYLNYDFISKCITSSSSTSDNSTSISLYTFLQKICDGINNSLGGVNKIEPIINEEFTVTLIDQNPIPGLVKDIPKENIVDLEVYGYNKANNTSNFVKNISFKTKITPDLATQVTIGATANGSSVKNEDVTAFSKWSEGLLDRFNQKYNEPLSNNDTPIKSDWIVEAEGIFNKQPKAFNDVEKRERRFDNGNFKLEERSLYNDYVSNKRQKSTVHKRNVFRDVNYKGIKGSMNFGQFTELYLKYQNLQKKKGVISQAEFNKMYTTDWSYYTSECFAGNINYEVEQEKENTTITTKATAIEGGGLTFTGLENKRITTTTKNITTTSHRYLHFDPSFIGRANNVYKSYLISWYKNLYNKTLTNPSPSPLSGFIPVTFDLTTQGISGVKIYNKLNINQQFLPKQYPEALKFLITGIDHTISNNTWETNLSTLSIPNTQPDADLQQLISDVNPSLIDYGVGAPQPDNSKEFIISANIQTISTQTSNIPVPFIPKVAIYSKTRKGYRNVTINETLELFDPSARTAFRGFFDELSRDYKGYVLYINDVFRTYEESQSIFSKQTNALSQGKSTFKPATAGTSYHNFGLAIDLNIKTPQNQTLLSTNPKLWRDHAIDRVASNNGIEWGVAKDYVHFWYSN